MMDGVVVRLEVEGMRYQILHHFSTHNQEIEKVVSDATRKALDEFSLGREAERVARSLIPQIVEEQIERSLRRAFNDPELREKIDAMAREAIR